MKVKCECDYPTCVCEMLVWSGKCPECRIGFHEIWIESKSK